MIDVVAVPDGFEQPVREPQYQDILHRLLSEIVVDAIDLLFLQQPEKLAIERARRSKIESKRLFNDEPPPGSVFLTREARLTELSADRGERSRRSGEIEQPVAAGVALPLQARQRQAELLIGRLILRVSVDIGRTVEKFARDPIIDGAGRKVLQTLCQ